MMTLKSSSYYKNIGFFLAALMAAAFISNCKGNDFDQESFSPSDLPQAEISGITVNTGNGDAFYCSISGGCPVTIIGNNFFTNAKVYIGDYLCQDIVITGRTQINCTAGPAQNGVYDIRVVNGDGKSSKFADTIVDPTTMQFSYTSFLYLGSQENPGRVYGYAQHPTSGALITIVGSPFSIPASAAQTYGVVIHPNNRFLYSANVGSSTVSTYSINPANGRLTAVGTPVASGSPGANGMFFHPTGKFLYVTNYNGNTVSAFSINSDGTPTPIAGSPFATTGATTINGVVVSSDGKFLYAASMGGNGGVVGFAINQDSGALTLIPGSPFRNNLGGDASNPGDGITIHPNGHWLYMGLVGIRKVSGWTIDPISGVLTPIEAPISNNSPTPFNDNQGSASTVSADGRFLYGTAFSTTGTDPKKIVVYAIDQTTGGLTRVSNVDTGGGPNDVRIDTTGNFAYTCNSTNPPSISAFSVNKTTGELAPLTPRDYAIPAPNFGPGIMVIQRNLSIPTDIED